MSAPAATETLLDWALSPSPDPAQSGRSLALRFIADVPEGRDEVFCERVTFQFDIDPAATPVDGTYLTADGTGIGVMVDPPDQWHLDGSRTDGTFTFVRPPGVARDVTGSYTFVIYGIRASPAEGRARVSVTECATEKATGTCEERTQDFEIEKFPPAFGREVEFTTDKTSVEPDGVVNLTWSGDPDARYQLYVQGRQQPYDLTHEAPPWTSGHLRHATEFTLKVSGEQDGKTVQISCYLPIFVDVPTVSLKGDKSAIRKGEEVTLTWDTEYVTDLTLKGPGAPGPLKQPPPFKVQPTDDAHYVLSGRTSKGTLEQDDFSVTVAQPAPPAGPSLVLVRTNVGDHVEVAAMSGESGFQHLSAYVTDFPRSEAPNGTWVITPYEFDHPWPDLVLIKMRDTDSSEVEVHYRSYASHYQKGGVFVSSFPEQFGHKGTWLAVKMVAARRYDSPDLVLVDTAAGTLQEALAPVTVQARAFERGFKLPVDNSPWPTRFQRMDAKNGTWLMADMAPDGSEHPPDLVFVQTGRDREQDGRVVVRERRQRLPVAQSDLRHRIPHVRRAAGDLAPGRHEPGRAPRPGVRQDPEHRQRPRRDLLGARRRQVQADGRRVHHVGHRGGAERHVAGRPVPGLSGQLADLVAGSGQRRPHVRVSPR